MSASDLTAADLIESMQAALADLKSKRARVEGRLNAQMRELEILDQEITQTQGGLLAVQRLAGEAPSGSTGLAGLSIADACEAIIRERGGEATVADIVATLQASGKLKEASRRSNYNTVASQMYRAKGRFQKVEGSVGRWRLASVEGNPVSEPEQAPKRALGAIGRDELERAVLGPRASQLRFRTDIFAPRAGVPPEGAQADE